MTRIDWHGDKVAADTKQKAWKRVMQAASYLKARIQQNVDTATAAAGPSRPGEYPHKLTGTLQKSIFLRPRQAELACDVGTKLVYGVHWETTNRPYIRRTLAEQLPQVKAILEGRMTRTIENIRAEAAEMRARHQEQKATIKANRQAKKETAKSRKHARLIKKKEAKAARKAEVKARKAERKKFKAWEGKMKRQIKSLERKQALKAKLAKMSKAERAKYKEKTARLRDIKNRPEEKAYARTKKRWAREDKKAKKELGKMKRESRRQRKEHGDDEGWTYTV